MWSPLYHTNVLDSHVPPDTLRFVKVKTTCPDQMFSTRQVDSDGCLRKLWLTLDRFWSISTVVEDSTCSLLLQREFLVQQTTISMRIDRNCPAMHTPRLNYHEASNMAEYRYVVFRYCVCVESFVELSSCCRHSRATPY